MSYENRGRGRPPAPIVVGQPLAGARWAALGSCCDGPHRRALYPIDGRWYLSQRFAIDFNQLEADNRPGTGDPALPTSFPTFGQPVYAVADGTVAVAVDGNPNLKVGEQREELRCPCPGAVDHISRRCRAVRSAPPWSGAPLEPIGTPIDDKGSINLFSPHNYWRDMEASGAVIYSNSGWSDGAFADSAIKRFLTVRTPGAV
jgi:hypothetical protein